MNSKICKGCGKALTSDWTCPYCGYTQWTIVAFGFVVGLIFFAIAVLFLAGILKWIAGLIGTLVILTSIWQTKKALTATKLYKQSDFIRSETTLKPEVIALSESTPPTKEDKMPNQASVSPLSSVRQIYMNEWRANKGLNSCILILTIFVAIWLCIMVFTIPQRDPESARCDPAKSTCAQLEVINHTNGTVTVKLSGNAWGEWQVSPGTKILQVKPGTYTVEGTCGIFLRTKEKNVNIFGKQQITYLGDC